MTRSIRLHNTLQSAASGVTSLASKLLPSAFDLLSKRDFQYEIGLQHPLSKISCYVPPYGESGAPTITRIGMGVKSLYVLGSMSIMLPV